MNLNRERQLLLTRRQLFGRTAAGIGTAALASLLNERMFAADSDSSLKTLGHLPAPHSASIADDIAVVKSMHTEAINHDPAITYIQTGAQQPGRPSMGSWLSYGLGSENQNLPSFVVLLSQAHAVNTDQPLFSRLWASGFLPSSYQGVRFGTGSAPVLYLSDPPGVDK